MTASQQKFARLSAGVALVIGLLIPVTVSPGQGIEGNEACANGACCRELLSVCSKDGSSMSHYYQSSDGVCTQIRM